MTSEETFKPEESLELINNMIKSAKNKLADDGFHFIFWGWLITICALINYACIKLEIPQGWLVWPILPPLGSIVSMIYGYRQSKKSRVRTYVDVYLAYVWIGFLIALFITLGFGHWHGIKTTYFFLIILYGLSTFITGGILNFRPLIIGACCSFAIAILSFFLGRSDQFLTLSAALIFSHIIPGHMLRSKYKSQVDV